ncbi:hypothetical protein E2C01_044021 [Portunus trituberculatus]|uniref:Uncharacterized protein n=1 Tax=Portunus trituberculatus TaxID=210409 RepID=A0A5B7FXP9_PORTR|nr:hypothetical protein [Portunus trituberculatus]
MPLCKYRPIAPAGTLEECMESAVQLLAIIGAGNFILRGTHIRAHITIFVFGQSFPTSCNLGQDSSNNEKRKDTERFPDFVHLNQRSSPAPDPPEYEIFTRKSFGEAERV